MLWPTSHDGSSIGTRHVNVSDRMSPAPGSLSNVPCRIVWPISVASSCLCSHSAPTPSEKVTGSRLTWISARPVSSIARENLRTFSMYTTSSGPIARSTRSRIASMRSPNARRRAASSSCSDAAVIVVI